MRGGIATVKLATMRRAFILAFRIASIALLGLAIGVAIL